MSTLASYSQHWSVNGTMSRSQETLQNHAAAEHSFDQAKRHSMWRRWRAWLSRRSVQLPHYHNTGRLSEKQVAGGVQVVPLDQIIGSEGRSQDFDDQFWPITDHTRHRWVSIAVAMGTDQPLPPVQLIKVAQGYVVRDGHHRLSVARAFGHDVIEAEII